jgi:hypothetical protein
MAHRAAEGLHQREIRRNADELGPALHVATHEGRIFLFGAFDEIGNRVVRGGHAGRKKNGQRQRSPHSRDGAPGNLQLRTLGLAYAVLVVGHFMVS